MIPNLDIQTFVKAAFLLAVIGVILSVLFGIRAIRAGMKLQFFRKRQDLIGRGWRLIFFSIVLVGVAFVTNRYAEPALSTVFPPSPTVTQTGTITHTPTITLTPTISLTPTITDTPSVTNTPAMPAEISARFEATTMPNPSAVISVIVFSREIDNLQPVEPAGEFENPVDILYGTFTYDQMTNGAQWTALWYRLGADNTRTLICTESEPWQGSTGGYGFTECAAPPDQWQPGEYEVQMFVGTEWKNSGRFVVIGDAPTPRPTASPTRTVGPTPTATPRPPTRTPLPTWTLPPTLTPSKTPTRYPTWTPLPTGTPTRTATATGTATRTRTPRPTDTSWPTLTPLFRLATVTPAR